MYITKEEAVKRGIKKTGICEFHETHPDQEGVQSCEKCIIIQDPCGCDEDMECDKCVTPIVKAFIENRASKSFLVSNGIRINW